MKLDLKKELKLIQHGSIVLISLPNAPNPWLSNLLSIGIL